MAKIFITGSADGLGQLAAAGLIAQGHDVVLHARNAARTRDAVKKNPGAVAAITGDLSDIAAIKEVAAQANELGTFDVVIHNAGIYQAAAKDIFTVNVLAPYMLTTLMHTPQRLVYLSSGMHLQGRMRLHGVADADKVSYSDSKLYVLMLCLAAARRWPHIYANAIDPGWVPTKMGGPGAPDDLQKGYETQVWLAAANEAQARVSGHYFFHKQQRPHNPLAGDTALQDRLLDICAAMTGVNWNRR